MVKRGSRQESSSAGRQPGKEMIGVVAFNIVMLAVAAAVGSGLVPASLNRAALDWMHNTIGITAPPEHKERMVALVWIGSTIVIVDGVLVMLVFLTSLLM
jgi:hypothetical protein